MASEFVDLVGQTQGVLPLVKGGTGNSYGWALGVISSQLNNTGSTWPVYSALAYYAGGGPGGFNPQLTTVANPGPFIGVVVGTLDPIAGTIITGDVVNGALAAVQTSGVVPMLVDGALAGGYKIYVSPGGGAANGHVYGYAAQTSTTIGVTLAPGIVYLLSGGGSVSSIGFLSTLSLQAGNFSGVVGTGNGMSIFLPWAATLTSVHLFADQVGSAVVDIYAGGESLFPPTTSIVSATPPTLSAASHSFDATLTGWTTTFAAGTVFRLHVTSASTVTWLNCQLVLRQTS